MYWSERQKQLYKAMEKDEEKLKKKLSSFYDKEYAKLDKTIAAFYEKFGTDNVIEYRTLMESLPEADKMLLIEQFDEFAKKYPQYAHLLPVRNNIYKLNRLEGLQYSVRMSQLNIGAVNNEEITKYLEKQAERGINAAAEAMGFGKNFNALNGNIASKFVGVNWSNGKNFSERIWENTDKLSQYLNNDIATGFARGVNYRKLTDIIQKRYSKVTRNDAYRLIYTEGTYVMAESSMAPFEDDFEQYRVSTVGDSRVCPICRDLSSQVFNIKDRQPGVNFPPLHPWCRCTFTIEVEDWNAWMDEYERKHIGDKISPMQEAQNIGKQLQSKLRDSIIKNIDIDDMRAIAYGKNIDEQVIQVIYDSLKPGERAGDYYINEVSIKSIPSENGTILMQIEPIDAGKTAMLRLNINQDAFAGKTIDEIDEWIKSSKNTVIESIEEAAIHERGHAKTIAGLSTEEINNLYEELSNKGVDGISKIAKNDGAEAIAEIEVLLYRGEEVSAEAKDLYDRFIGRKSK